MARTKITVRMSRRAIFSSPSSRRTKKCVGGTFDLIRRMSFKPIMAHNVTHLNKDLQRLRPGATTPSRGFPGSTTPSLARFDRLPYNVITDGSVIGAARKVINGKEWARTVDAPRWTWRSAINFPRPRRDGKLTPVSRRKTNPENLRARHCISKHRVLFVYYLQFYSLLR